MCGVCGIIDSSGSIGWQDRERYVSGMIRCMRHRGPNGEGIHSTDTATLGTARLSIQDISDAGAQPWKSVSTGQVLVFNGEIYNADEIWQQRFSDRVRVSTCDTEVLSACLDESGPAALDALRGMFAFALWDERNQTLFAARDRIGEKPLVYAEKEGVFAFASEINALLSLPWVASEPDWEALHYGLHFVHVPAPFSAFRDIRKLPPATWLRLKRGKLKTQRYWLYGKKSVDVPDDYEVGMSELRDRLADATRMLNSAEVPVGVLLSGGLDSSSVVASLGERAAKMPSFRIAHRNEFSADERLAALAVANRFGTEHRDLEMHASAVLDMERVVGAYAEPVATLVSIDTHRVCEAMASDVTVVLTGNGSDELFGGYPDHCVMRDIAADLSRNRTLKALLDDEPSAEKRARLAQVLERTRPPLLSDPAEHYVRLLLTGHSVFLNKLYSPGMREMTDAHPPGELLKALYRELDEDIETAFVGRDAFCKLVQIAVKPPYILDFHLEHFNMRDIRRM